MYKTIKKKLSYINYLIIMAFFLSTFSLISCNEKPTKENSKEDTLNLNKSTNENFIPLNKIANEDILLTTLKELTENTRDFKSNNNIKAAEYLKNKLIEYNYDVTFQDFNIYEQDEKSMLRIKKNDEYFKLNPYNSEALGKGRNVIGKTNTFDENKKTFYLTAHYDTTDYTTGVIDNATGTVTVLEIARLLKDLNSNFNVAIVFLDGEEHFRYGSKYFVANLSDKEKENILGVINVDMVGEKNGGEVVMQTTTGNVNLLSVLMENVLDNEFKLSIGGFSDDLSFYMGKIPAITIANKKSDFSLDKESTETQLNEIDIKIISNVSQRLYEALTNLQPLNYEKFLENSFSIKDEKNTILKENKDFKLIDTKESFIENGFDIKQEFTYEDSNKNIFTLIEEPIKFIPLEQHNDFIVSNTDKDWGYKIIKDSSDKCEVLFYTPKSYCKISGNISKDDALRIIEDYYINYFNNLFEEVPKNKLFIS